MKKIKSIKQLRAEKIRIKHERLEIEKKMSANWDELKEAVRPANIAREAIGSIFRKKTTEGQPENKLLNTAINIGLSLLAGNLTEKALQKLGNIFTKSRTKS
jgi:hypothetical protein